MSDMHRANEILKDASRMLDEFVLERRKGQSNITITPILVNFRRLLQSCKRRKECDPSLKVTSEVFATTSLYHTLFVVDVSTLIHQQLKCAQ